MISFLFGFACGALAAVVFPAVAAATSRLWAYVKAWFTGVSPPPPSPPAPPDLL